MAYLSVSGSGTNAATTSAAWIRWNSAWTCTTNEEDGDTTWGKWTYYSAATEATTTVWSDWFFTEKIFKAKKRTAAEIAADKERAEKQRLAAIKAEEVRLAAEAKARELLWSQLSAEQRQEADQKKHFHLISEKGRRYRIDLDTAHGNVRELSDKGLTKRKLCAQPKGVPKWDQILAQKLALEHCEDEFLKVANAC